MIKTTPVPPAAQRAQHDRALHALAGLPVGAALRPRRPSTSTSRSATAVGVFDTSPLYKYRITRPRRRAVPRPGDDPRHPHVPARPGAVHRLVRRPRLRARGRRGVPALRQRVPADRGRAQPRLPRATSSAGSGSRSRTSATTTACSPSRARARAQILGPAGARGRRRWRSSSSRRRQDRRAAGHASPAPATPATSASRSRVAADDALGVLDAVARGRRRPRLPARSARRR